MLDAIRHPIFAEAFPGEHIDRTWAQQRPEGGFDGSGVGAGHNADDVIGGEFEEGFGFVDRAFEAVFAEFGPVGAAEDGVFEIGERPAGVFGTRAGRKVRAGRTDGRLGTVNLGETSRKNDSVGSRDPHSR